MQGLDTIAQGLVVRVLADHGLPAQDMQAVFPSPKLVPSKVIGFIGFLQTALQGDWWLEAS